MHPDGREMTPTDWHDDGLHTVGMFVSGDPLRSPGPRGEQLARLVVRHLAQRLADDVEARLPENAWVKRARSVLVDVPAQPARDTGDHRRHAGAGVPLGGGAPGGQ